MTDTDVERGFAVLMVGDRAGESQLSTRSIGSRGLLLALGADGRKHLLAPTDEPVREDVQSRGVHLTNQRLRSERGEHLYADLACVEPTLDMVFDRLAQDVVDHVEKHRHHPAVSFREVLEQWRELLRRGSTLTPDTVIGLVGELHVLALLADEDPVGAIDAWTGPRRTVHDFVRGERALEVKSVATLEGTSVTVNGIDQLDPSDLDSLHLAVVHCRESEGAPSLDARIDLLIEAGVPAAPLLSAVADAGYVYESRPPIPTSYRIVSTRFWSVGPTFPGLRRSSLPPVVLKGVSRVQYALAVDSAPPPLSEDNAARFPGRWMSDVH